MKPNWLPRINNSVYRSLSYYGGHANPKYVNTAHSGKENFEKDFGNSHVRTNLFQKVLLGVGSGLISITSPQRGDMIAVMGEVTGSRALEYIYLKMIQSPEGRKILEEKPRISSGAVDLEKLKDYPGGTLGKAYSNFLEGYGYTPDTRNAVKFVDDFELAYVAQRYREVHDLFHTLLGMPTNMLGEVTVKWVEAIQLKLPMCAAGALFGSARLAPKLSRAYSTKPVLKLDSSLSEKIAKKEVNPKSHPGVMHVKCVSLPEFITTSIYKVIERENKNNLLKEAQALENKVTCRQVPLEELEMQFKKKQIYEKLREKFSDNSDENFEKKLSKRMKEQFRFTTYNWKAIDFNAKNSLIYLVSRGPSEYAAVRRVFNEIIMRDKEFAPQNLFDFGSGVGTVTWAAHHLWGSSLKEYYCVDSSKDMNDLACLILTDNDPSKEPLVKNVYYRQFLPASPNPYDIVVSSFSFFELPNLEQRMKTLSNLWNKTKDYLVLIENGTNSGYQLIAEARDFIINASEEAGIECYIFAPCSHELRCPRLDAIGKKTPCNFFVKFNHLNLSTRKNQTGTQLFSYLIVKKGKKPFQEERQGRIVREVLKRHRHVKCDLCTNDGLLREVVASAAKFGAPAYKCVRFSNWGDLIPGKLELRESGTSIDFGESISDSDDDSDSDSSSDSDNEGKK